MVKRVVFWLATMLGALALGSAMPGAAAARAPDAGRIACHAFSGAEVTVSAMLQPGAPWSCADSNWGTSSPVGWLRFDAGQWRGSDAPRHFLSRITRFRSIEVAAVDADGAIRSARFTPDEARVVRGGPIFELPLPSIDAQTRSIVIRIDHPHNATVLSEARITATIEQADWSQSEIILLALIAGMLITPLLFDINFYVVLRERFVLLHAGMVVSMLGYVLLSGGLITVFVTLPITFMAIAGPLVWALGVGLGAFFSTEFLEPEAITPRMRRMVRMAGWWTIVVPGFCSFQFAMTQRFDNTGYFYGFMPVIAIYVCALIQGLFRGSVAARFLVAAWIPIIAASAERLVRGLGLYSAPRALDQALFVALGLEVLIIAIGVANRFIAIKRDRDTATSRASDLADEAARDPLTGLLNRRAIEPHFAELRRAGFHAMAVIDLDHFKAVNDVHGHAVGDRVLRAVAGALQPTEDILAVRLGGEEFVLLLRGRDALRSAEQRRAAIPTRVAAAEPGLDRLVTASMGMIECPPELDANASFALFYARADRLLYEAKRAGRNRTVSERMNVFKSRPAGQIDERRVATRRG